MQTRLVYYLGEHLDFVSEGQVRISQHGSVVDVEVFGECSAILHQLFGYLGELVELLNLELGLNLAITTQPVCASKVTPMPSPPTPPHHPWLRHPHLRMF